MSLPPITPRSAVLAVVIVAAVLALVLGPADRRVRQPNVSRALATLIPAESAQAIIGLARRAFVQSVRCERQACTLRVDPAQWERFPYDSKRDMLTGIGHSLAVLHGAERTHLTDLYTGKEIARYSVRTGIMRIH